jgi:hypothetical protein
MNSHFWCGNSIENQIVEKISLFIKYLRGKLQNYDNLIMILCREVLYQLYYKFSFLSTSNQEKRKVRKPQREKGNGSCLHRWLIINHYICDVNARKKVKFCVFLKTLIYLKNLFLFLPVYKILLGGFSIHEYFI